MIVDGNGNIIEERRKANRRKEEKPKLSKENRKEERRKNKRITRLHSKIQCKRFKIKTSNIKKENTWKNRTRRNKTIKQKISICRLQTRQRTRKRNITSKKYNKNIWRRKSIRQCIIYSKTRRQNSIFSRQRNSKNSLIPNNIRRNGTRQWRIFKSY